MAVRKKQFQNCYWQKNIAKCVPFVVFHVETNTILKFFDQQIYRSFNFEQLLHISKNISMKSILNLAATSRPIVLE